MSSGSHSCGRCGSPMIEGRFVYRVNANHYPVLWVEGIPSKRSFLGIKGQNIDVSSSETLETANYRCTACGLIETYAVQGKETN